MSEIKKLINIMEASKSWSKEFKDAYNKVLNINNVEFLKEKEFFIVSAIVCKVGPQKKYCQLLKNNAPEFLQPITNIRSNKNIYNEHFELLETFPINWEKFYFYWARAYGLFRTLENRVFSRVNYLDNLKNNLSSKNYSKLIIETCFWENTKGELNFDSDKLKVFGKQELLLTLKKIQNNESLFYINLSYNIKEPIVHETINLTKLENLKIRNYYKLAPFKRNSKYNSPVSKFKKTQHRKMS